MNLDPSSRRSLWLSLALGFAAGAGAAAVVALLVIVLSLSAGGALMVVIQVAFGRSGLLATLLLYGAVLSALVLAVVVLYVVVGRIAPVMHKQLGTGRRPAPLAALVLGLAAGLALTGWALPASITSSALQFLTGQTAAERAARPAVDARSRRLEAVLAAHPDGPEALLLKAVNRTAHGRRARPSARLPGPARLPELCTRGAGCGASGLGEAGAGASLMGSGHVGGVRRRGAQRTLARESDRTPHAHSTVTLFAKFRGLSTSVPLATAV